jgi:hypothetical protein
MRAFGAAPGGRAPRRPGAAYPIARAKFVRAAVSKQS